MLCLESFCRLNSKSDIIGNDVQTDYHGYAEFIGMVQWHLISCTQDSQISKFIQCICQYETSSKLIFKIKGQLQTEITR